MISFPIYSRNILIFIKNVEASHKYSLRQDDVILNFNNKSTIEFVFKNCLFFISSLKGHNKLISDLPTWCHMLLFCVV